MLAVRFAVQAFGVSSEEFRVASLGILLPATVRHGGCRVVFSVSVTTLRYP